MMSSLIMMVYLLSIITISKPLTYFQLSLSQSLQVQILYGALFGGFVSLIALNFMILFGHQDQQYNSYLLCFIKIFYKQYYTDDTKEGSGKSLIDLNLLFVVFSTSMFVIVFQFFFLSVFLAAIWESYRVIEIKYGEQLKFELMTMR